MFNLALVDQKTVFGLCLTERQIKIDDEGNLDKKTSEFIRSQAADNFCGVMCAIGYLNMRSLYPDLMEHVNAYARSEIEFYDSM